MVVFGCVEAIFGKEGEKDRFKGGGEGGLIISSALTDSFWSLAFIIYYSVKSQIGLYITFRFVECRICVMEELDWISLSSGNGAFFSPGNP